MKTYIRGTYLENHQGSSFKFYQPAIWRDEAGAFHVDAAYGRIGSAGSLAPKYEGTDSAAAIATYERLVNEKLRGGYREAELNGSALAFRVERGARVWDLDRHLAPLRDVPGLVSDTEEPGFAWHREGVDGDYQGRVIVSAEPGRHGAYRLEDARPVAPDWPVREFLRCAADAGFAPLTVELAESRVNGVRRWTLIDVWELRGESLVDLPGSDRILLREQLAELQDATTVEERVALPASGAAARWGIDLAGPTRWASLA